MGTVRDSETREREKQCYYFFQIQPEKVEVRLCRSSLDGDPRRLSTTIELEVPEHRDRLRIPVTVLNHSPEAVKLPFASLSPYTAE